LSEVKLSNEKLLSELRLNPGSMSQLLGELTRAYDVYAKRVGNDPEAQASFRNEAVRILGNGDTQLLEPALSTALHTAAHPTG
jgi:hypothetical protein